MSDKTINNEEALKDYVNSRIEIIELDFSYVLLDEGREVREFSITNDVKLSGFVDGYKAALMNELSKGQGEARPFNALVKDNTNATTFRIF